VTTTNTNPQQGCAQLKITGSGSGSGSCSPKISIPGEYKASGVGILIPNIYENYNPSTYTGPGGPIATCGGSNSGASKSPAVPKPTSPSYGKPTSAASKKTPPTTALPSSFSTIIRPAPTGYTPNPVITDATPAETPMYGSAEKADSNVSAQAKKWDQCGGTGFSGPTKCESGTRCVALSTFYSHCII